MLTTYFDDGELVEFQKIKEGGSLNLSRFILVGLLFWGTGRVNASVNSEDIRLLFEKNGVNSLQEEDISRETPALIRLGKHLFFEKALSGNRNISCATCHHPRFGSGDGLPVSLGTGGLGLGPSRFKSQGHLIPRNAPAAFNLGFASFSTVMWDGRISIDPDTGALKTPEKSLNGENPPAAHIASQLRNIAAVQAMFPVTSNHEMRGAPGENEIADAKGNLEVWRLLTERLVGQQNGNSGGIPKYIRMFRAAYPSVSNLDHINFGHVARAIAAYENYAFRADESPFDEFMMGDDRALTRAQLQGAKLFLQKAQCIRCHSGPHLTDFRFYSIGAPQLGAGKGQEAGEPQGEDRGLALITGNHEDNYKFKTPTLRNVALTGPWTHSGSVHSLYDVIQLHTKPVEFCESYRNDPRQYFYKEYSEDFLSLVDSDYLRFQARMSSVANSPSKISLTRDEINDLVAFLHSLTDKSFYARAEAPSEDEL